MVYNPKIRRGKYIERSPEKVEIEKERFFSKGGEIEELPEQVTPRRMILTEYASCEMDEIVWLGR